MDAVCMWTQPYLFTFAAAVRLVHQAQTQTMFVVDRKQFSEIRNVRIHKRVSVVRPSEITPLVDKCMQNAR